MIHQINYSIFGRFPEIACKTLWTENENFAPGKENAEKLFLSVLESEGVPAENLARAEQIHGGNVETVIHSGIARQCDGLITDSEDLNLLIRTADCAAVMVYDPVSKAVGNWHSGWRGTFDGIVGRGILRMIREFGSNPADFYVAVGPSAHACCYEVGREFYDFFPAQYFRQENKKIFLNLPAVILDQLSETGIPQERIELSGECTFCSEYQLPSYRRTKTQNRLLNVISRKSAD